MQINILVHIINAPPTSSPRPARLLGIIRYVQNLIVVLADYVYNSIIVVLADYVQNTNVVLADYVQNPNVVLADYFIILILLF